MIQFDHMMMSLSAGQMYAGDFEILSEFSKDKEVIVELGTSKGLGSMVLASHGGKVYTVDNFCILNSSTNGVIITEGIDKNKWAKSITYFLKHWGNIEVIESDTANAANRFEDNSVDLLYIDGDHIWYSVERDYDAWISKVKKDGIILFHDCEEGVHDDVFRFCKMKEEHDEILEVIDYETECNTVMKIFRKII